MFHKATQDNATLQSYYFPNISDQLLSDNPEQAKQGDDFQRVEVKSSDKSFHRIGLETIDLHSVETTENIEEEQTEEKQTTDEQNNIDDSLQQDDKQDVDNSFHEKKEIVQVISVIKSAEEKASEITKKAIAQAAQTTEKAIEQAEKIEKDAYEKAFAKGEQEGKKSCVDKFKPVVNDFRNACIELEKIKKEISQSLEKNVVELSFAIATKIVCNEVSINKEVVLNVVKESLNKATNHEKIKIKINSDDFQFITNPEFKFLNPVENIENAVLEKDDAISKGGCIIETSFGEIDARIENQLKIVKKALDSELKKSEITE